MFAWVNDLTSPPAAPSLERCSAVPSGSRKLIACPLEKPPQKSQTVKLRDQRRAENWPWGMPITPVRLEMRRTGDRKMSHNAAFCLGERQIRRPSGLPVLLFTDEEAGSGTRGKQCTEWSQWMLRSGSIPVIPAGTAQSIIDAAPTKHAASMLQIFPHCHVYIQQRGMTCRLFLSDGFPRIGSRTAFRASCRSVTQRICQRRPPPITEHSRLPDPDYGDSSCWELSATTCLFWSPPLRRDDSERWGTMWPGPNRLHRQQGLVPARSSAHRPPSSSISELRKSELANCTAKSVTLGEGGIQACWLVFTQGLNRHLVPPRADSSPGAGRGGALGHNKEVLCGLLGQTTWPAPLKQALLCP